MIAVVLIALIAGAPPYRSSEMSELEAILGVLEQHVARVVVESKADDSGPLEADERDGFGVVIDQNKIALLCFLVTDAKKITIEGRTTERAIGRVILYDVERRVAIVESLKPLSRLGLTPAKIAPKTTRKLDDEVFSLTTIGPEASVMHGVFTYVGDEEEYGGHSRIDLLLARGAPVFDAYARFVGFSRNVAWDKDRYMLVTPEMIKEARTSTGAAQRPSEKKDAKPWWAK